MYNRTIYLAIVAGLFIGCSEDPAAEIDRCIEDSIAEGRRAYWIQGQWRITGTGERVDCTQEVYNADEFKMSSRLFRVHQQGHFVFLEEDPRRDSSFVLGGMVGDRCIHVRTSESSPQGSVAFSIPGWFTGSNAFSGGFTGTGPGACTSSGEFSVSMRLDPVPPKAGINPASPESGLSPITLCEACRRGCETFEDVFPTCIDECELQVCNPPTLPDAGADALDAADDGHEVDAEDAAEDAQEADVEDASDDSPLDVEQEAADDAQQDVSDLDAVDEDVSDAPLDDVVADQDAEDSGEEDAADAGPDAPGDAADDSSTEYVVWDGNESGGLGIFESDGGGLCAASSGARTTGAGGFVAAFVAALAVFGRRRRARPAPGLGRR